MRATPRQEAIIALAAEGLADKQIAQRLGLSVNTVRTHLERLFRENGFNNRAEAVAALVSQQVEARIEEAHHQAGLESVRSKSPWWRPRFSLAAMAGALIATAFGAHQLALNAQPQSGRGAAPAEARAAAGPSAIPSAVAPRVPAPASAPTTAISRPASPPPRPAATPVPAPPPGTGLARLPDPLQLTLVNADRAGAGLPALAWNPCLAAVATDSARRLSAQVALPALPLGAGSPSPVCGLGTPSREISGYWPVADDAAMNSLFMSSAAQKAVILGSFRYLGAAWAVASTGVAYLVLEFA